MVSGTFAPRTPFSSGLEIEESAQPMVPGGSDLEFSFDRNLGSESCQSPADELFADGMILPTFHRACDLSVDTVRRSSLPPPLPVLESPKSSHGSRPSSEVKSVSRSFWGFKRSASLSDNRKGLICAVPVLSRSNSTGSVPNLNRSLQKQPSTKTVQSSSFSTSSSSASEPGHGHRRWSHQKPPSSRKTSHGSSNGAPRVGPILNVPSPYIIGAPNLFGLTSFFCNGKDKKKIRRCS